MTNQILVYGSLRKARENNRFMSSCEFVEEVRVPGFDLHTISWYPGIRKNPTNEKGIVGEVYKLPDDGGNTLFSLDMYEGYNSDEPHNSLFTREEIEVKGVPTYVYVYGRKTEAPVVESGDWNNP